MGMWFFKEDTTESLQGKRVLITGASAGIGEQLAYHYARLGCRVAVTARRKEVLDKVTKLCHELSPQNYTHFAIAGNMAQVESTKQIISDAIKELGGLDILVLNHIHRQGIGPYTGKPEDISNLTLTVDVNFKSYVLLTTYALPELTKNQGSIIVVNSTLGKLNHPFLATYCASKHALNGFFGSLRSQFLATKQNISLTMCTLGFIGTESCIEELKHSGSLRTLNSFKPASPSDTALAIIQAGARKDQELHYPISSTWPLIFLRTLLPKPVDALMRYFAL